EAGRAKEVLSNWVSKPLANDKDAQDGIALLRDSYRPTREPEHPVCRGSLGAESSRQRAPRVCSDPEHRTYRDTGILGLCRRQTWTSCARSGQPGSGAISARPNGRIPISST